MKTTLSSPSSRISSVFGVKETQTSASESSRKVRDSSWKFEKERDLYGYERPLLPYVLFQISLTKLCGFTLWCLHRGTLTFVIKSWK